jgi:CheY-like chemotaxis protein
VEAAASEGDDGGTWARIDPDAFQQALGDILARLRSLMGPGGRAVLSVSHIRLHEPRQSERGTVPAGTYVCLELGVTGLTPGRRSLDRALETFATSEGGAEAGPAMGLAPVLGLLHQSESHLSITRPASDAAMFTILSPAIKPPAEPQPARRIAAIAAAIAPAAVKADRVLVVEDEGSLRRAVARFLERLGYEVVVAEHGKAAARFLETHTTELPELVLTDLVMPIMGGRELGGMVLAGYPAVRMLYMTGYTADEVFREQLLDPALPVLRKPFSLAELVAAVEGALGRPVPRPPADLTRPGR